jgi:hypothetical protein
VSDANEKPIACPFCGSDLVLIGDYNREVGWNWWQHPLDEYGDTAGNCIAKHIRLSLGWNMPSNDIAAWNRRTFVHPSPLASTLAAYLTDGDTRALELAQDVCLELDLWERAKGELDRQLMAEVLLSHGARPKSRRSDTFWIGPGEVLTVFLGPDGEWLFCSPGHNSTPIKTLRQFLHLCGLFGITPRK